MADEQRWNHNIHYHRMLLDAMQEPCTSALDVGCGEGVLARRMRQSISEVTAIDVEPNSIEIARRRDPESRIDYRLGDFMTASLEPASFRLRGLRCRAAPHGRGVGLRRMRELVRPGGTLAVVGLARSRYPADLPRDATALVVDRAHRLTAGRWESPAPTLAPPPHTYREIRLPAERTVPGVRFRRQLLWRYSMTWTS